MKVLQLGYGYWGEKVWRNLVNLKVAHCLIDKKLGYTTETKHPAVFSPWQTLFETIFKSYLSECDAVAIITPPETHYELIMLALENKKHVFVEKPMCMTLTELAQIEKQLTHTPQSPTFSTGHIFLYDSAIQNLRTIMQDKHLGNIYHIECFRTGLGIYQRTGVVWDLMPHDISIVNFLLDKVPTKIAKITARSCASSLIDLAYIDLYYGNTSVHINVSWLSPIRKRTITVIGSEGMAVYDMLSENQLTLYKQTVQVKEQSFNDWIFNYQNAERTAISFPKEETLKIELVDWLDCIQNNKAPRSGFKEGSQVVKALCAIIGESIRSLEYNLDHT